MSAPKPKLIRKIACDILARAEKTQSFTNILLDDRFKRYRHILPTERALITEMVYGVLRNQRLLDLLISHFSKVKPQKMERRTLLALRLGIYQVVFMKKIPEPLAVNESVSLVKLASRPLVNAVLRTICRRKKYIANLIDELLQQHPKVQQLAIRYSHPDWLVERWLRDFEQDFVEQWLQKNNEPAPLYARVNTLKIERDELIKALQDEGLSAKPCEALHECILIENASSSDLSKLIKRGLFVIQDLASQLVSYFLEPNPNDKILDACAAPGTKTTHIAQLSGDSAKIVAVDINGSKLKLLSDSAIRLGLKSITTLQADLLSQIPFAEGSFDKVLVDAPCANLGLLRRHPEIRWKREPVDLEEMAKLQLALLNSASKLVRSGGLLVYSVCSISKEENEGVISEFLSQNPNYELVEPPSIARGFFFQPVADGNAIMTFPHLHDCDGFFIIRMRRKR